jgi:hypothetical protein
MIVWLTNEFLALQGANFYITFAALARIGDERENAG